jgi:hypothetical protein
MISICPDDSKPRSCIASAVIVTGRIRVRSFVSIDSNPSCRRHDLNANLLFTWRRATSAIDAPSWRLSSTIWRFSSRFHDRRLRPTGAKSPSLPTAICLGVHHQIVDTIIEPLFRQLSQNLEINARRPTAKGYIYAQGDAAK